MSTRRGEEGGSEKARAAELPDIDALLARADAAVEEAQRIEEETGRAEQEEKTKIVRKTKAQKEEEITRVEMLETEFGAATADRTDIEPFWEVAFYEAEQELGIAPPEKMTEIIGKLRAAGEGIQRFRALQNPTSEIVRTTAALEAAHAQLLAIVKAETLKALDQVKKKYKGEVSETEARLRELVDGPLAHRTELAPETKEGRMETLRQSLREVLLRPLAEGPLAGARKEYAHFALRAEGIIQLEKDLVQRAKAADVSRGDLYPFFTRAQNLGVQIHSSDRTGHEVLSVIRSAKEQAVREQEQNEPEARAAGLNFELNRAIIEAVLAEEGEEDLLQEALINLSAFLGELRRRSQSRIDTSVNDAPKLSAPLAKKLLARLLSFGQPVKGGSLEESGLALELIGGTSDAFFKTAAADVLLRKAKTDVLEEVIPGTEGTRWSEMLFPLDVKKLKVGYRSHASTSNPDRRFRDTFPTEQAFVQAVFAGKADYLNLRRARMSVAPQAHGDTQLEALSEEFASAGWKQTASGAWVEPNGNMRSAEAAFKKLLEAFSDEQVRAQDVFETRAEDGTFVLHTREQALDLLHRARRDALMLLREQEEVTVATGKSEAELNQRLAALEEQVKGLERERAKTASAHQTALDTKARQVTSLEESNRTATETVRTERSRREEAVRALEQALATKPKGLFGGDYSEILAKIQEISEGLK